MDALWYFAYGSNMCGAIFRERRGMHPLAARVAWLADHRLCFNIPVGPGERGVANVEPEPGTRVCGVAYLLTTDGCARLDRSEGVHVELYWREPVELLLGAGERVAAFTYRSSRTTEGRLPSPRYMGLLLDGAAEHRLPDDYVSWLRRFALARDERSG
ncbi:MAG TPA: gamma-glutamylcyclotransferase family protein [Candidatus Dormibacteraeota bacterium]|nr:gamma-glutamylcyclotransferase family protein [Candidatus Dormibacteraeota bacterium]